MLDDLGFDLWADGYDASVGLSDKEDAYPFAGYKSVLSGIYEAIRTKERPAVLDLGFGTATLTARLYQRGCEVYGQDFSRRMVELAREKMPGAHLYCGDFSEGLCPELADKKYDFIISTYALHHLDDEQKTYLIRALLERLNPGGQLLIGDVAFADRAALERCQAQAGEEWDNEEVYFVYDELRASFPRMVFEPVSHCAGILCLGT